ncbi:SIMPL domain-containing protein [Psychroserpens luteolus]|uniref:SIMPL domain-containing protein n=1 Tax=Psychroserpens luteolus TaxID=2855840 RepID=UPI001E37EF1F|nr:SIMPL domain-containing protein [Psychroserpens luteolus]MCD2260573.1 SIMPL domain-containing protein [Psychroserpens luteolus]
MKNLFLIITLVTFTSIFAQVNDSKDVPFIEVIGTATQEVVPDIISIEITLSEKVVNRKNYTIVEQENNLKTKLNALNISLDKLSLSDSNSIILRNKRRQTGVKLTKEFILTVNTSEEVTSVFRALNDININEASIVKTESSKIDTIRREVRIEAIKAAKEKAAYLLEAIDEELGKPIEVKEYLGNNYGILAQSTNTIINRPNASFSQDLSGFNQINFETFTVKFSYYIKYAIK